MVGPSTTTRLLALLFLFSQVSGVVIPVQVPAEMVPENLMIRDPDSQSGFSINHGVLKQLLTDVYSSSVVKRTGMRDVQGECGECENEEEEHEADRVKCIEENVQRQPQILNNNHQYSTQVYGNQYNRPSHPQENLQLEDQRTQERKSVREYIDSGKETFKTIRPQSAPQAFYQRHIEQTPSNYYQSTGVEQQTISGQFPFTEFSQKTLNRSSQTKVSNANQRFIQDSSRGMQQRYAQQLSTIIPTSESNIHTIGYSGGQPTRNVQTVEQEAAQRDQPAAVYRQYDNQQPSCPLEKHRSSQAPSQHPPKLQIGKLSVHRTPSPYS